MNEFSIVVQSFDANASPKEIESSGPTAIKFQTLPGSLQTKMSNLGSDVVGDMTNISLEFTLQNGLDSPKGQYLVFNTPKWNPGTQSRNSVQSLFSVTQSDWNSTEQAYNIPCTSAGNPNVKCYFMQTSISSVDAIANSSD